MVKLTRFEHRIVSRLASMPLVNKTAGATTGVFADLWERFYHAFGWFSVLLVLFLTSLLLFITILIDNIMWGIPFKQLGGVLICATFCFLAALLFAPQQLYDLILYKAYLRQKRETQA